MFVDVCIPKGNEKVFLEIAEKLGTEAILFLYDKKKEPVKHSKIKTYSGVLTKKKPGVKGIYFAKGERFNVEDKMIKYLYSFETLEKNDTVHYRRSGMNQVIAKIMKEKEKTFVVDFERILESNEQEIELGRLKQNLTLIRKYDIPIIITSFATKPENMRGKEELKSLIKQFGFEKQAKEAVNTLHKQLLSE